MMNGNGVADFNSFIFYLIGSSEGFEPQIYWPPNDVPTIGYGVALITKDANANPVQYGARDLATLNNWFNGVHTWTQADQQTLADIASELESDNGNETDARAIYNSWNLRTTLTLTEPEGRTVFCERCRRYRRRCHSSGYTHWPSRNTRTRSTLFSCLQCAWGRWI